MTGDKVDTSQLSNDFAAFLAVLNDAHAAFPGLLTYNPAKAADLPENTAGQGTARLPVHRSGDPSKPIAYTRWFYIKVFKPAVHRAGPEPGAPVPRPPPHGR